MKKPIFIVVFFFFIGSISAQSKYSSQQFQVAKITTVDPKTLPPDFNPALIHLEMPMPGSSKYMLQLLKQRSAKLFPRKQAHGKSWKNSGEQEIEIGKNFPVASTFLLPTGDTLVSHIAGGIPNDNTICISNGGKLITAFNTRIFTYNTFTDTMVQPVLSLHSFSSEFTLNDKYDPKLLYDPIADRFILVFLNGRESNESLIIVAFSSTNDPSDAWHLYGLSGNPLGDSTWTDYPAMAITNNELFITGNLLRDSEPWQTGFSQTVVWQVDKQDGYNGDSLLTTRLWHDIEYNGERVRNLNPVQGGSNPTGPNMYLLSNKNFTLLSDTVYLVEITGEQDSPSTKIKISMGQPDTPYGAPPNGRQDHVDSMATNDARVLGAFIENGEIQFVANTIDTATGFAAVYHGFVSNLETTPQFSGRILRDDSLDFGYPNIAYTGNDSCSRQAVIGFNHTSPERNPGFSALLYHSDDTYSNLYSLKEAESPVDRLSGYERWGDYFGIQRKYNEPGTVWLAGFYGRSNSNFTWVYELFTPVETALAAFVSNTTNPSAYGSADGNLNLSIQGGYPPYSTIWNSNLGNTYSDTMISNLPTGTYAAQVTDNAGCTANSSATLIEPNPSSTVFPNPFTGEVNIFFEMTASEMVYISLYDLKGALVKEMYHDKVKQGRNVFSFSTSPIVQGTYIIKITSAGKLIHSQKIVKN